MSLVNLPKISYIKYGFEGNSFSAFVIIKMSLDIDIPLFNDIFINEFIFLFR